MPFRSESAGGFGGCNRADSLRAPLFFGSYMQGTNFSQLTPVRFLQTFVLELMHVCEDAGLAPAERLIDRIARSAGRYFEEAFREEYAVEGALDPERYAELIVGLKNHIGGQFSLVSREAGCIRLTNRRCPFGEGVKNSPELCRMTSSVFGGIAARNFGYAKVTLARRIALGDARCEVHVHLDPQTARNLEGTEYLAPPAGDRRTIDELQARIDEQMHRIWCQMNNHRPSREAVRPPTIVARSPAMQAVLHAIETVAPTPATVLIHGETGVGKELVARAIHAMSERCQESFIAVNCGAIPEGIVESALFGHEKGAFTGAVEVHHGYFERADGGTLFLDEVDALTPATQTRLLRVIQEGELERVGGHKTLVVDTRIISATNCDLEKAVAEGRFRQDLYYRLNVVRIVIPPLRQRPEDVPHLVGLILERLSRRYGKPVNSVSPEVMSRLLAYAWPGNVRELENALEKAMLFAQPPEITEVPLPDTDPVVGEQSWKALRRQTLERLERSYLEQALRRARGSVNAVAEWMELTPRAVYLKLSAYGVDPAKFRG
ncbi:sigma-54 dependent transcriptional regulator [Methylococcus capsulatus str. Bath]|uniref:Sigma-54 dependent transcriptional regulator n=2 Tax=Methylococcus capsulatus TaxID=414 RepID=Q60AF0_METCA|nr:sigma 54-interacting transcriptional regulator [Methylococcus capsulatus]AAU92830.1 sigma-54 dependent transcriptional regulator [Methylococcus capsulatus str. Bath]